MALDSSFGVFNEVKWGLNDSIQIGTGYARDLYDLRLWWINESAIGFARVNAPGAPSSRIAVTVQGSTGLKYNFFTERWRPFLGFMLEIFQIFNAQTEAYLSHTIAAPTWGAFRPMAGIEWLFDDDMSFEAQAGYVLMLNFEDPVRHSLVSRLAYRLYF